MSKYKKALIISVAVLTVIIGAGLAYLTDYYPADEVAIDAFANGKFEKAREEGNLTIFGPKDAERGFIFYPGGKVDHSAYIPLMQAIAEKGIFCVLVEMPFNLAVFDGDAGEKIPQKFPEISRWYIGGHSLGGAMAADFAEDEEWIEGLVILAAYSMEELRDEHIPVLSIYGSNDGVLNRSKYEKYKINLPRDYKEIVIEGGNHAGFGMYGPQKGDFKADITPSAQIIRTADEIAAFIGGK